MYLFIHTIFFIFRWSKINAYDPLVITLLETDECDFNILIDFDIMHVRNENESDIEEEYNSFLKIIEQYEGKPKYNLEETKTIDDGTRQRLKKLK